MTTANLQRLVLLFVTLVAGTVFCLLLEFLRLRAWGWTPAFLLSALPALVMWFTALLLVGAVMKHN